MESIIESYQNASDHIIDNIYTSCSSKFDVFFEEYTLAANEYTTNELKYILESDETYKDYITEAFDSVKSFASKLLNAIKEFFAKIFNFIKNVFSRKDNDAVAMAKNKLKSNPKHARAKLFVGDINRSEKDLRGIDKVLDRMISKIKRNKIDRRDTDELQKRMVEIDRAKKAVVAVSVVSLLGVISHHIRNYKKIMSGIELKATALVKGVDIQNIANSYVDMSKVRDTMDGATGRSATFDEFKQYKNEYVNAHSDEDSVLVNASVDAVMKSGKDHLSIINKAWVSLIGWARSETTMNKYRGKLVNDIKSNPASTTIDDMAMHEIYVNASANAGDKNNIIQDVLNSPW